MKTMIRTITLYSCLAAMAFGGNSEEPKVHIKPYSLRLNNDNYKLTDQGEEIRRGTTVGILFKLDGEREIVWQQSKDSQEYLDLDITHHLVLKDSKQRNMGEISNYWVKSDSSGQGAKQYYFHFDKLPNEGTEWLELSGEMPLYYWSEDKMTDPQAIRLEEGAEITAGIFDMKILSLEEHQEKWGMKTYRYKIQIKYKWKDKQCDLKSFNHIRLTDRQGNEIDINSQGGSGSTEEDGKFWKGTYLLSEKPDEAVCTLIYQTPEKENVSVKVRFDL